MRVPSRQQIAVIGTGISGMSAAWLLSRRHDVTVYEQADRVGGHSNTVMAPGPRGPVPVDTGFIVYNEATYPNLTALFDISDVPTKPSEMSFAVSLDGGALEYSGTDLRGLFAQPRNLLRPRFWSMLRDLRALLPRGAARPARRSATMPRSATISTPAGYGARLPRRSPAADGGGDLVDAGRSDRSTIRPRPSSASATTTACCSCADRPVWRTVRGGSRAYVERLTERFADRIRLGRAVAADAPRRPTASRSRTAAADAERFDHVVHRHAMPTRRSRMLAGRQRRTSGACSAPSATAATARCCIAIAALMPRRRAVWSSWNYVGRRECDRATASASPTG